MIKTQKDYIIKIVNYKGKSIDLRPPEKRSDFYRTLIALARLYERARRENFLTKELFSAIKSYAEILYNTKDAVIIMLKNPPIFRVIREIINTDPENLEEEVIYGKVRVHEYRDCSVCGTHLVYPAYIVFKKDGTEVKRSNPIGIKCLNSIVKKLNDLVEEIRINWKRIETDRVRYREKEEQEEQVNREETERMTENTLQPELNTAFSRNSHAGSPLQISLF